jgi:hypothetical protein
MPWNLLKNYLALVNRIFVFVENPDNKKVSTIKEFKTISALINNRSVNMGHTDMRYFNCPVPPKDWPPTHNIVQINMWISPIEFR